jgi:hypothetical protein
MKCLNIFSIFLITLSVSFAQEFSTTPSLGLAFPLEQRADGVYVKQSILINSGTLLPAGSKMRTIFVMPERDDGDVKTFRPRKVNDAFVRQSHESRTMPTDLSPIQEATIRRATGTVWENENAFRASLERLRMDTLRLVYQEPSNEEIRVQHLELIDGLLLAEDAQGIVILAVEKNSQAEQGGAVAGMRITHIEEHSLPVDGGLQDFKKSYSLIREESMKSKRQVTFKVMHEDNPRELTLTMPRSLSTDLWSELESSQR